MHEARIAGVGFWCSGVSDWTEARELLTSTDAWPEVATSKPAPSMMPANERRRAPESVLLAMTVAGQACAAAGIAPGSIPSVFASAYGDLSINDYLCGTLASDPASLSPTKFHNSVHNAPSGYWSIATGAMRPTTAITGFIETFAAGLLETVVQVREVNGPVLFVAYDISGAGPMAAFVHSTRAFGCALLLEPAEAGTGPRLHLKTASSSGTITGTTHPVLTKLANDNPIARGAGALLEALANGHRRNLRLRLSPALDLDIQVQP